jgi:hypothetical protein
MDQGEINRVLMRVLSRINGALPADGGRLDNVASDGSHPHGTPTIMVTRLRYALLQDVIDVDVDLPARDALDCCIGQL